MCISVSPFTAAKNKIMDTSIPVNFDNTSILMPYPKESGKISVLVEPFKREVLIIYWFGILKYLSYTLNNHLSMYRSGFAS